jgi:hypothetical protein
MGQVERFETVDQYLEYLAERDERFETIDQYLEYLTQHRADELRTLRREFSQ